MKSGAEKALVFLLSALTVVAAAARDHPEQAEVIDHQTRDQRNLIPDPDMPVAPTPPVAILPDGDGADAGSAPPGPPPWQADEDRLWALLRAGRLNELDTAIDALSATYPEWRPPPRLLRLAETERQRRVVSGAGGEALVAMAARYPDRFSCREIDNLWRLAEAQERAGAAEQARDTYLRILAECSRPADRLATVQKASGVFSPTDYLALVEDEFRRHPAPALARLRLDLRRSAATEAAAVGRCAEAVELLGPVADQVLAARDPDAARLLGWCHGESGEPAAALPWLERAADWAGSAEDRLALAAALVEAGRTDEALQVLGPMAGANEDAAAIAYDVWIQRAAGRLDAGDCRGALDALVQASRHREPDAAARRMRAWALFDCGRDREAAEAFASLYGETADDEDARGLVLADFRRRSLGHAREVASSRGGPLAERLPEDRLPTRAGRIDYSRLTLTGDGRVRILRVREWAGLAGIGWNTRQGDGPSELDAWRLPVLEVEHQRDRQRFELRATRLDLDSGDMGPGDFPVNTDRITGVSITDSESGAWEPVAFWSLERYTRWFLEFGATPMEGEVSATWQGRLGASRFDAATGWSVAAVRTPVEESVLSWTGARGEVEIDGQNVALPFSWGRVTRNGVDATGYFKVSPAWTISGDLKAGDYRGHNVDGNLGGQFYGLAERRWRGEGETGFWAGPYVYLSGFQDNRSKFAPGHGGYFSPAWLVGAGLAGRWRTESADHPWYLEVRGSAGYQTHEEDAADLIPDDGLERRVTDLLQLSPEDLGRFGSTSESGFAGTLEVEGLRRLGASEWYVGGLLRGRVSPEFDNAAGMLVVRYGVRQKNHVVKRQFRELFSLSDR